MSLSGPTIVNHDSPTAVASRNQTTKLKDCDDGALITGHLRVQDHFDCIHKEWVDRSHTELVLLW
jgi:hypothetical protein